MAQYIYSFAADEFYLITFLVRPGGDLLLGPFLPFTADVWIMLVASVLLSILAFAWLEITPRMQATYALMKVKNQAMPMPATRMEKVKNSIRCFLEVVLMSMEGVLDFHPEGYNCMSNAGKLLKMGYIMFMVLFMATYTANLASILVSSQSKVEFNDLSGAIDAGVRICVPEVLVKKLSLLHPRLQPYVIPTGFEDVMDTMDTGVCRVGISYDAINDVKQNKHCNKVEVGSPLVVLPVSNLAQPHLAQAINAAIEAQVGPGLADQIQRKYVSNYIYENQIEPCVVDTVTSNDKLNVIAMAGLFSLLAIIVFTAILLDTCERSFPKISGYRGGIEFKLARRAGGTCYLRDDWKNTYVLRLPPGLHYPEKALYDNPEPDEDTQSDSGDEGPWQAPVQRAARPRPASGQEESTAPRPETANDVEVYPLPPVIRVEKGATPCDGSWASSAFGASPLLAADVRSGESVDHLFEECRSSAQQSDGRVSSLLIKEDAQEFMLLCDDEPSIAFGESLSKGDSRGQEYVDQQASAPAPEITNDVLVDPLPVSVRVEKGATPCDGSPASSAVAASPLLAVDAKSRESVDQLLEECHHGMPCDDEPADAAFEERESLSACDSRGEESYGKQDSAASNSQLDEVGRVSSLKAYFDKGMPSRRS